MLCFLLCCDECCCSEPCMHMMMALGLLMYCLHILMISSLVVAAIPVVTVCREGGEGGGRGRGEHVQYSTYIRSIQLHIIAQYMVF